MVSISVDVDNSTIYELNVRQFTTEGTLNAATLHLSKLNELGIGIIWIMPVQPIGVLKRKGSLGSPYSISDYSNVNSDLGTLSDFKNFVETAHKLNILVILDWVANHTAWDHPWIGSHPEYYTTNEHGVPQAPFPEWSDVADLNYTTPLVWEPMVAEMNFWLENCNIDGFRCDMAHLVPDNFWKFATDKLNAGSSKKLFWLAESERRELLDCGFNCLYNWNLFHVFNNIAAGIKTVYDIDGALGNDVLSFPKVSNQLWFTSNHDENAWSGSALERFGNSINVFTAITFLLPGIPLIYNGQEFSSRKRLAFFEKDLIERNEIQMFKFYQKLIKLKKENTLLWNNPQGGEFKRVYTDNGESVFVFLRKSGDKKILFLANLSNRHAGFTLEGIDFTGEYYDFFIGGTYTFFPKHYLNFAPFEFKIYYTKN